MTVDVRLLVVLLALAVANGLLVSFAARFL
jgi:hypothetical protein